jgi:hypothetical protein
MVPGGDRHGDGQAAPVPMWVFCSAATQTQIARDSAYTAYTSRPILLRCQGLIGVGAAYTLPTRSLMSVSPGNPTFPPSGVGGVAKISPSMHREIDRRSPVSDQISWERASAIETKTKKGESQALPCRRRQSGRHSSGKSASEVRLSGQPSHFVLKRPIWLAECRRMLARSPTHPTHCWVTIQPVGVVFTSS